MHFSPRLLYGLHERFLLVPYVYGARRCRLVLRVSRLRALLQLPLEPTVLMAPLVLGEMHGQDPFFPTALIPTYLSGAGVHSLHRFAEIEWYFRWYRMQPLQGVSVRFEAGSRTRPAAHTQYYSVELLKELTRPGESHGEARRETERLV